LYSQPIIDWVRRFNSSGSVNDYVVDMKLDKEENIFISGIAANDSTNSFLTIKYNDLPPIF